MRRRLASLVVAATLVVAACGGEDTADPDDGTDPVGSVPATDAPAPPATIDPDLLLPDECADEPDPSVYVEGAVPLVIPPCSVPDDLVVHTIRDGSGDPAEAGDTLFVDYIGMIIGDGEVFDTSYTRGQPLEFQLGRGGVIAGWDQGLIGAQTGSLLRLDIPNELAYGDTPPGEQIEPGDALSFYVEVRAIAPAVTGDDAPLSLQVEPSIGATELTTTDVVVGDGPAVELGRNVIVHLLLVRGDNEVVLFNTWENGNPLQIRMEEGQTLPGIFEGLQGATVGTTRVMAMPPELAFGEAGETGLGLPAGTDLIVVAEIIGTF
ncbi:MAG: FKBP-type peptidyl-prolyl cis-trans isomerase [Acidimicrobiia bacterium]